MDIGIIQSIWTILVMVIFLGIVIWAWNGKRKSSFDEAARIPLDDDDSGLNDSSEVEGDTHA